MYEQLARSLKCPPEFVPALYDLVPRESAAVMLLAVTWIGTSEMAVRLNMAIERVDDIVRRLYQDGLLSLKTEGNLVKAKSFYAIINTFLGEGRLEGLPPEKLEKLREFYLTTRLDVYDRYLETGRIETSSEVLTTQEALSFHRHPHDGVSVVVAADEARKILRQAGVVALLPCSCRLTFRRCDKPVETCLNIDTAAEEALTRGMGREISRSEAAGILAVANREGLVHLAIYAPGQPHYALCSCCPCCCHDLQALLRYGRTAWVRRAGYIAETDRGRCLSCGICAARCYFGARTFMGETLILDESKCYGCGLCVSACPAGAIEMRPE
jgi:ferredoxin